MTSKPPVPTADQTACTPGDYRRHYYSCWGAVLAGTITALGIHFFLATLGMGFGLAPFRSVADVQPVAMFSVAAAMAWSLFAIIALSLGGWVAGRVSGCPRSGMALGFLVWSLTLVVTLPLLALGTSLELNRAMKPNDENRDINHQAVVFAEHDLAETMTQRSLEQLRSFGEEAAESVPTNATPKAATRAQREVGFAVTKLFAPDNLAAFRTNREDAINALMVYTEMNAADATATINDWTVSHANLQVELDKIRTELTQVRMERFNARMLVEQQAQADADQMVRFRSRIARWSFFAILIGLLGASLGGRCGGECAARKASSQRAPGIPV